MEKVEGFNYQGLISFMNKFSVEISGQKEIQRKIYNSSKVTESVSALAMLSTKASAITPTEARRLYGFDNMNTRAAHVETCLKEAQELYEAMDSITHIQDRALLDAMGLSNSSSSSDVSSEKKVSLYQHVTSIVPSF